MATTVAPITPRSPVTVRRGRIERLDVTAPAPWRPNRKNRKNPDSYVYLLTFYAHDRRGRIDYTRVSTRGYLVQCAPLGLATYRSLSHFASRAEARAWAVETRDRAIRDALRVARAAVRQAPQDDDARHALDVALRCRQWAWGLVG